MQMQWVYALAVGAILLVLSLAVSVHELLATLGDTEDMYSHEKETLVGVSARAHGLAL